MQVLFKEGALSNQGKGKTQACKSLVLMCSLFPTFSLKSPGFL